MQTIHEVAEAAGDAVDAPPGSRTAERLAEKISHLLRRLTGTSPVHVRVPTWTWQDRGTTVTWAGRSRPAYALPPQGPGLVEAEAIRIEHLEDIQASSIRGRVLVAPLPPNPWSLDYLYTLASKLGAVGLIAYSSRPVRWCIGYYPYTSSPPRTPIPAVIVAEEDAPREGSKTRITVDASIEQREARIVVCRTGRPGTAIVTHHDYTTPYREQVLAAIASAIEAAEALSGNELGFFASVPQGSMTPSPVNRTWWGEGLKLLLDVLAARPRRLIYLERIGERLALWSCSSHGPGAVREACRRGIWSLEVTSAWLDAAPGRVDVEDLVKREPEPPEWYKWAPLPLRRSLYRLLRIGFPYSPSLTLKTYPGGWPRLWAEPLSLAILEALETGGVDTVVDTDTGTTYRLAAADRSTLLQLLRKVSLMEAERLDALYLRLLLGA